MNVGSKKNIVLASVSRTYPRIYIFFLFQDFGGGGNKREAFGVNWEFILSQCMVRKIVYHVFVVLGGVCFDRFGRDFAELGSALV